MNAQAFYEALCAIKGDDPRRVEAGLRAVLRHLEAIASRREDSLTRGPDEVSDVAQHVAFKLLRLPVSGPPFTGPAPVALVYVNRMVKNRIEDLRRKAEWERPEAETAQLDNAGNRGETAFQQAASADPLPYEIVEGACEQRAVQARRAEIAALVVEAGATPAERVGWEELAAILFDGLSLREVLIESGAVSQATAPAEADAVRARDAALNRHRLLRRRLLAHVDRLADAGADVERHRQNLALLLRRQKATGSNVPISGRQRPREPGPTNGSAR